jgi:hypothetical protein
MKGEHTSKTNDTFCTPRKVWQPVIDTLGPIGFDPCSHPNASVPAATRVLLPKLYYRPKTGQVGGNPYGITGSRVHYADGLEVPWSNKGLLFVNPPYSRLQYDPWIQKGREECEEVVYLLPVRTSAGWWQDQAAYADAITFWRGRIVHEGMEHGAPFHQALAYFGPRRDVWLAGMGQYGWTVLGGAP